MSGELAAEALMSKTVRASASARALPDLGKTHAGLIAAFGLQLVKNGPITKELGRLLKRAEEIRLVADYKGDSVELEDAREMVGQAAIFVDAMRTEFMPPEPDEDSVITP
jgi:hypothetical protein